MHAHLICFFHIIDPISASILSISHVKIFDFSSSSSSAVIEKVSICDKLGLTSCSSSSIFDSCFTIISLGLSIHGFDRLKHFVSGGFKKCFFLFCVTFFPVTLVFCEFWLNTNTLLMFSRGLFVVDKFNGEGTVEIVKDVD